jgi:hypothetical protein
MASAIYVSGPSIVQAYIGSSWLDLGYSDNDDLPAITFTDHQHEIKTVASGNAPAEIILQNTTASISVTLVQWDAANYASMLAQQRGAAGTPVVGRPLVSANHTFGVRIKSVQGGNPAYTFSVCHLRSDSVTDSKWGNVERRLSLNFNAIPDPTTNVLYTYANI